MFDTKNIFFRNLDEHEQLFSSLYQSEPEVTSIVGLVVSCMRDGGKLMVCGNGGSAGDSQHIAAEFTGRFIKDRKPLPALALTTDTSALTCIANDYDYDDVFCRQLEALSQEGDVLLVISTSGNSSNLVRAAQRARDLGVKVAGLLGRDGGKLLSLCDCALVVPSNSTARIQEAHILVGHTICGAVEQALELVSGE